FFNSFLSAENNTLLTTAGEAAALSSVSRMLSNQLNRLAERYIKGVELSIDVDSYLADYGTASAITEMQVGLSKQLFDERLTLRVGTDINLNNERNATLTEGNFSTIAGDFVLEYKLNPAGNYLLRVFHRSNYNVLDEANTYRTGASILFKKSFNGKRYE
ncbi:MAG: translocation/assembly module TamB domain-containing protein, partial [Saprospiraceae bacterium]|nr:translocation/assembly module TamB domain-containing protein [Saprospiraceae bacterium]